MDLSTLMPQQLQIVKTLDRPLFVSAGAGSGKTFTLTRRIVYALSPESGPFVEHLDQVLAITFTKDAAAEIRDRVRRALIDEGMDEEALTVDDANALPLLREEAASLQARLDTERKASLLSDEKYVAYQRALALIDRALRCDAAGGGVPFSQVKTLFGEMVDALDARIAAVSSALDNAFRFVEDAFGNGQEMLLLVTDLSVNRYGMAFINDHGCERYFAHNEDLLFYERGADLADRINRLDLTEEEA